MYKVTLNSSWRTLGFIFDDIQKAAFFVEDVLKHHDQKNDLEVSVSLYVEESTEESEVAESDE